MRSTVPRASDGTPSRFGRWRAPCLVLAVALGLGAQTTPAPTTAATPGQVATVYDLIYALTDARLPNQPSPFLVESVAGRRTGTALDLGSGSGRNSLYLAGLGYGVTAVDISPVGLSLTRLKARQRGLRVRTVTRDLNRFRFGTARWDLIALINFPFAYQHLLPRIAAGLRPGGLVVIQGVSIHDSTPQPASDPLHYTFMDRRQLQRAFAGYRILEDDETQRATQWGGKALMVRFCAEKPDR